VVVDGSSSTSAGMLVRPRSVVMVQVLTKHQCQMASWIEFTGREGTQTGLVLL
jgi:hypothetical protein